MMDADIKTSVVRAEQHIRRALEAHGLTAGAEPRLTALTGGVSAAIFRVDIGDRIYCAKYALAQLKVDKPWYAPPERLFAESAWLKLVGEIIPGAVPDILFEDRAETVLIMSYLPPEQHRLWKADLLAGVIDSQVAQAVGDRLGRIHAATAYNSAVADRFRSLSSFHALRTEPYLLRTAALHPDCGPALQRLAEGLDQAAIALVHGDVSPKNILIGQDGPIFLDAECAGFGEPAFDVAFCLNHLFLKSLLMPARWPELRASIAAFRAAYAAHVAWEPVAEIEARVAALLPALMLARLDGASPVEYLTATETRDRLRVFAKTQLLALPESQPASEPASLSALISAFGDSL